MVEQILKYTENVIVHSWRTTVAGAILFVMGVVFLSLDLLDDKEVHLNSIYTYLIGSGLLLFTVPEKKKKSNEQK